jgi:hypothetical protein
MKMLHFFKIKRIIIFIDIFEKCSRWAYTRLYKNNNNRVSRKDLYHLTKKYPSYVESNANILKLIKKHDMNRGDGVDEERMGEFLSVLPPHFCICRSLEFSRSLANRSLPRRTPITCGGTGDGWDSDGAWPPADDRLREASSSSVGSSPPTYQWEGPGGKAPDDGGAGSGRWERNSLRR